MISFLQTYDHTTPTDRDLRDHAPPRQAIQESNPGLSCRVIKNVTEPCLAG